MNDLDCIVTIVSPVALEDALIAALLEHPEWVSGFTTAYAEGLGQAVMAHGVAELVRGRSRRIEIQIVMHSAHADALIASLRSRLPSKETAYWITPVSQFGRFA